MNRACRIDLVVGTRPNIIKLSPLVHVLRAQGWCEPRIVFVGQHTSPNLSGEIFEDLGIDVADVRRIPLSSSGYGERLGEIISSYTRSLASDRPHVVVVFGDVDVTLGAALAAKRAGLPLVHIEAGLRSGDMDMPEEMNRILVDSVTDLFFPPSEDAFNNLVFGEAKDARRVHFAGNIMIDSLVRSVDPVVQEKLAAEHGLQRDRFCVATFHRPSNVDDVETLTGVVELLEHLASFSAVVVPLHPRTEAALQRHMLRERLASNAAILDMPALRYSDFINLLAMSPRLVLTDSGGIQEETSYFGVPCLTYRDNTERPVTVRLGTNVLVNRYDVRDAISAVLSRPGADAGRRTAIPLWDGATAYRIATSLRNWWRETMAPDGKERRDA